MYEYEDIEKESVKNTKTGEVNIRPGTWKWDAYQAWLGLGGNTKDFVEDAAEKEKQKKTQSLSAADNDAQADINLRGTFYRSTAIDRTRIAMALALTTLPYIELVTSDGSMQYTDRDTLVELANLILQRDKDIYGRITAEFAKAKV